MKYIVFLLIVITTYGCCKECTDDTNPACSNYNPCKGKIATTASFKIYDNFAFGNTAKGWVWQDTDTVGDGATFEADMPAAIGISYEWQIGAGTYYTRKVSFPGGMPMNSNLSATLTVRNAKIDISCFPKDTSGMDTKTRKYFTTPSFSRMEGVFRGAYTTRPYDSIDFTLRLDSHYTSLPYQQCRSYYAYYQINNGTAVLGFESPTIKDTLDKCYEISRGIFLLSRDSKTFSLKYLYRPHSKDTLLLGRKIKSF